MSEVAGMDAPSYTKPTHGYGGSPDESWAGDGFTVLDEESVVAEVVPEATAGG
jgi:hypothetical protein